jgi:hypothetical protein
MAKQRETAAAKLKRGKAVRGTAAIVRARRELQDAFDYTRASAKGK